MAPVINNNNNHGVLYTRRPSHGLLYSRTERLFDVAAHWAENVTYNAFFRPDVHGLNPTSKYGFDLIKKNHQFLFIKNRFTREIKTKSSAERGLNDALNIFGFSRKFSMTIGP